MPLYEIRHSLPLTPTQKDSLADAITTLHSTRFSTLRNFVNVAFHDTRHADIYVGGRRRPTASNAILAHVRSGPARPQADWDALCADLAAMWERVVVGDPAPRAKGAVRGEEEEEAGLRAVFVVGGLIAGLEAGVPVPPAGGDGEWLERNWGEMVRRAEAGEREWVENVREVEERGLRGPAGDGLTAQQRLEEML